jgi:hypothetical protein
LSGGSNVGRDRLCTTEEVREEFLRVIPFVRRIGPPEYSSGCVGRQPDHLTFVAEEQNHLVRLTVRVPSQSGLHHEDRAERVVFKHELSMRPVHKPHFISS